MSRTSRNSFFSHRFASLIAVSVAGLVSVSNGYADSPEVPEATVSRKVERGLAGIFMGVLEIPGTMLEESRERGLASGLTLGFTQGLGRFVAREVLGVYQLLSAPFAAPDPYPELLHPEFPWSYFDERVDLARVEDAGPFAEEAKEFGWIRGVDVKQIPGALVVTFPSDLIFEVGSTKVSEAASPRLMGLAQTLFRHPQLEIEVQGHADATGGAEFNQRLSERRAAEVRDFLVAQGLSPQRILATGFGTARPVASNDSVQGRRANRRVEVELRKGVALVD